MYPIQEQGSGQGIGHSLDTFFDRFDSICEEHLAQKRAKAFAFIFYDFADGSLRRILKDKGVFTRLDRLAGTELSIFYLHQGTADAVESFNSILLTALNLGGKAKPPCVVFFKVNEGGVKDIMVAQLDSTDIIHGFNELYETIGRYVLEESKDLSATSRYLTLAKSALHTIATETFRAVLRRLLDAPF